MSGGRKLFKNIFWLACGTSGMLATSLMYGLLAARYLGPEDFGRFSLIIGIGSLMSNMAQGAGTSVLTVLTAQNFRPAGVLVLPGIISQALVGTACLALSVPLVLILGGDRRLWLPATIYCLGSVSTLIYSAPIAIFRGLNKMQWGVAQTVAGMMTVAGTLVVIHQGANLRNVIAVSALAQVAVLLLMSIPTYLMLPSPQRWQLPRPVITEILRKTTGLSGVTVFQSVHWKVGLVMVQLLGGAFSLGLYTAGAKPIENLRAVPLTLLMSIFPTVSTMARHDQATLQRMLVSVTRILLVVMLPMVSALVALSPTIVNLFYGSAYVGATKIFSLSVLALVPSTLHLIFIMPLVANHQVKNLALLYTAGIIGEIGVDLIFFQRLGIIAAVGGAILAATVTAILADRFAFPRTSVLGDKRVLKLLAAGSVSLALPFSNILLQHRIVLCIFSIVAFACATLVTRAFTLQELRNPKSLVVHNDG